MGRHTRRYLIVGLAFLVISDGSWAGAGQYRCSRRPLLWQPFLRAQVEQAQATNARAQAAKADAEEALGAAEAMREETAAARADVEMILKQVKVEAAKASTARADAEKMAQQIKDQIAKAEAASAAAEKAAQIAKEETAKLQAVLTRAPKVREAPPPFRKPLYLAPDAPPLAMAPFNATEARKHQRAWADYLGLPVEREIQLPGGEKLTLVLIPPGEFMMGSPAEELARFLEEAKGRAVMRIPCEGPQHRVRITRPFRLGRHGVTVGQFHQFVEETAYKTEAEQDGRGGYGIVNGKWIQDPRFVWNADPGLDQPVVNVSWNDAIAFCKWLSDKTGAEFVLPSEAQWEYACRAGTATAWHCGDSDTTLEEYAWFHVNAGGKPHRVGQLKPNGWGLYDMYGNVWEWCADWHGVGYYAQSPPNDPSGPPIGSRRVIRGGSWCLGARICRSAYRGHTSPAYRHYRLGFRLALALADE